MFVLHVSLQVELLELGEPAEAEQADDLPAEVVAEVPLGPRSLERAAIIDASCHPLKSWKLLPVDKLRVLTPKLGLENGR